MPGVWCKVRDSIGCTNNKHCWSYDLSSFTIGQTTNKSFSAVALFYGARGRVLNLFKNTLSQKGLQCAENYITPPKHWGLHYTGQSLYYCKNRMHNGER